MSFTLVIGGAASGKSAYAESLIMAAGNMPRTYIATMQPYDEECLKRIAKHRDMRRGKGFDTIECYTSLSTVKLPMGGAVLLECISNLAANERYNPKGAGKKALEVIIDGIDRILCQCNFLVVVSNDVFCDGRKYDEDTMEYMKMLSNINIELAQRADKVCEVVCGIPCYYKGGGVQCLFRKP